MATFSDERHCLHSSRVRLRAAPRYSTFLGLRHNLEKREISIMFISITHGAYCPIGTKWSTELIILPEAICLG